MIFDTAGFASVQNYFLGINPYVDCIGNGTTIDILVCNRREFHGNFC